MERNLDFIRTLMRHDQSYQCVPACTLLQLRTIRELDILSQCPKEIAIQEQENIWKHSEIMKHYQRMCKVANAIAKQDIASASDDPNYPYASHRKGAYERSTSKKQASDCIPGAKVFRKSAQCPRQGDSESDRGSLLSRKQDWKWKERVPGEILPRWRCLLDPIVPPNE